MSENNGKWFFLSFRDPDVNLNLGCCSIHMDQEDALPEDAVKKAWDLGINPGGEVLITETTGPEPSMEPGRLYTRDEMIEMQYKTIEDRELGKCSECGEGE